MTDTKTVREAFALIRRDLHSKAANKVFDEALAALDRIEAGSDDEVAWLIETGEETHIFYEFHKAQNFVKRNYEECGAKITPLYKRAATAPNKLCSLVDKLKYAYTMPNTCFEKDGYVCALVFENSEQAIRAAEVIRQATDMEHKP